MDDTTLYGQILGVRSPWEVTGVELRLAEGEVLIRVGWDGSHLHHCPCCERVVSGYDTRHRRWRHLDTCQYQTLVEAEVPRVTCPEHGVRQISVPWAEDGSRYTALFEALVIDWLKESSVSGVGRLMGLSWNAIDGIMSRAVARGMARREEEPFYRVGVDETAFRKRHDYVTILSDAETGKVLHVGEDRKKSTLKDWYSTLSPSQREVIESVSMDLWPAYIHATLESLPGADRKICFDKFHVAGYLGKAVDQVRRQEHKAMLAEGEELLKGTRYDWLSNPKNRTHGQKIRFKTLRDRAEKTAEAWSYKEAAMSLWNYVSRVWAQKAWREWLAWALSSKLSSIRKVASTIQEHLWGIINAVVLGVSNGPAESINSRIKTVKTRSRGFRNKQRFANAIYFHLGGLDLYPAKLTHTN